MSDLEKDFMLQDPSSVYSHRTCIYPIIFPESINDLINEDWIRYREFQDLKYLFIVIWGSNFIVQIKTFINDV